MNVEVLNMMCATSASSCSISVSSLSLDSVIAASSYDHIIVMLSYNHECLPLSEFPIQTLTRKLLTIRNFLTHLQHPLVFSPFLFLSHVGSAWGASVNMSRK